ncbi:MAG: BMP family ABC transporter substrate-binding protein [Burkholderiales bacterium]|jgi:simple sugar transport system substrate-binding protein|nr:BMP family ABC transporter substrate-binding protein [Burkholderiales bacterium]
MHVLRWTTVAALSMLAAACGRQEPPAAPQAEAKAEAKAAQPPKAEPLKVGFVYVSPIGDAGWTTQHNRGREQMQAALGDKVTTSFVEKVPEGADAERVIRDLAAQGHRLVFTTSFGFMNPTLKVAEEFPQVKFEHATGYKRAANVGTYNVRFYEGRYAAGVLAGRMTRSDTLGYVGAFPIPEVLQGINAFTLGARSVNPKAQVRVIWVNSWYDPGKERDAANALIGQGADIVTHHTDSSAVVATAEEKGRMAIAYHSDMSRFGPKAQLAAVTHHWGEYYTKTAQSVLDGSWKPGSLWGGMKDGMIKVEAFNASVPKEVVEQVEARAAAIKAGEFHPFTGPIVGNDGREVAAKGAVLTDEQLGKMDYYVQGVVGKVPAAGN